ncbi:MAG: hypothetical protein P8179_22200 [Candidatus Thiodiazotropha sp.]
MNQTERFCKIRQVFKNNSLVFSRDFIDDLDISHATFHCDIEYPQTHFNAFGIYDHKSGAYRFDSHALQFTRPGILYTANKAGSLLTIAKMLYELLPGLLEPYLALILERISKLLEKGSSTYDEVRNRIRIFTMAIRKVVATVFLL